jgi:hypothetical protein
MDDSWKVASDEKTKAEYVASGEAIEAAVGQVAESWQTVQAAQKIRQAKDRANLDRTELDARHDNMILIWLQLGNDIELLRDAYIKHTDSWVALEQFLGMMKTAEQIRGNRGR